MSLGTNLPGNFSHFQETGFRAQIQWFVMCETLWQFSLGEDVLTLFVLHQHHSIISHVFAFILAIQQTSKRDVFSIINMNKCDAHLLGALSTHFHSAILPVALLQSLWMPSVFLWFQVMFSHWIANIHVDKYHWFCRRLHWLLQISGGWVQQPTPDFKQTTLCGCQSLCFDSNCNWWFSTKTLLVLSCE